MRVGRAGPRVVHRGLRSTPYQSHDGASSPVREDCDAADGAHRKHSETSGVDRRSPRLRSRARLATRTGCALRVCRARHNSASGSHRIAGHYGWRTGQAQLRHLFHLWPGKHRAGWHADFVRGRTHSNLSPTRRRTVQVQDPCRCLPGSSPAVCACAAQEAVVSASALSLLYPRGGIRGYSREEYLDALIAEQEGEIRRCLKKGAHVVQMDFTEGRLSIKLDPTRRLLHSFIDLNNLVLERFSAEQRKRIGVHTCPGADRHSTHSAEVDYAELLPSLFELQATNFCVQLASEPDRTRVLKLIREHARDGQRVFVGVIDPLNPRVETPEEVRDRALEAAGSIRPDRVGTTDDCGFAPFSDDTSRTRETAFDKIRARVAGTALASTVLGLG